MIAIVTANTMPIAMAMTVSSRVKPTPETIWGWNRYRPTTFHWYFLFVVNDWRIAATMKRTMIAAMSRDRWNTGRGLMSSTSAPVFPSVGRSAIRLPAYLTAGLISALSSTASPAP